MPDFHVDGSPDGVRSRAATMRSKAESFISTGDGLAKITTDGWNSRAADRFRDKFDTEPERWRQSGDGFITAAGALEAYAGALESAQSRAEWAEGEYARGEQVTQDAKAAYDADVSQARDKVHAAAAAGQVMTLTIVPFDDPGAAIRQGALDEYASAKADLEAAAHTCADGVRAGCAAAPEKRKWYESAAAAVGGFLEGAGEALMDLGELAMFLTNPGMVVFNDMMGDVGSGMTPEEIAVKYQLKLEDAKGLLDALQDDPVEFGKNLGQGLLDWDTWSDDPSRALGHLLPDAVIAVLTAGAGTAATRGAKGGVDALDALGGMSKVDDLAALGKLDDLDGLGRLDDLDAAGDLGRLDDVAPPSADEIAAMTNKQKAEYYHLENPTQDMPVWRVFGEAQDGIGGLERGSRPFGESWTSVDPRGSSDFRWDAGLPDENPGRFVVEGILRKPGHVDDVRPALPLDGNPGGWPEYLIRDAWEAVEVRGVHGVNEPWTRQPGDWTP